jgi:RNA polymerase sigma-70 factor (ECF subfamily)
LVRLLRLAWIFRDHSGYLEGLPQVTNSSLACAEVGPLPGAGRLSTQAQARVRDVVVAQFGFIWRLLRHLGVAPADVDDAAQQAFLIASKKIDEIEVGHERSFLYGVAIRIAAKARHAQKHRFDREAEIAELVDTARSPEELIDGARKRALFDGVLDAMDLDLRAVFVLHELERLTMSEIAETLELPPGTVASRLRRARAAFRERVLRIDARMKSRGGLL